MPSRIGETIIAARRLGLEREKFAADQTKEQRDRIGLHMEKLTEDLVQLFKGSQTREIPVTIEGAMRAAGIAQPLMERLSEEHKKLGGNGALFTRFMAIREAMGKANELAAKNRGLGTAAGEFEGVKKATTAKTILEEPGLDVEDRRILAGLTTEQAMTEIVKLQRSRDKALAEGRKGDAQQISDRIAKITAITGTTEFDPSVASDKQLGEMEDLEIQTRNFLDSARSFKQLVARGREAALSAAGGLSAFGRDVSATFRGFGDVLGVNTATFESGDEVGDDPGAFDAEGNPISGAAKKADTIWKRMGIAGTLNAQIKSDIVNLAFAAAAATGQTGRAVSDRDYENFVRQLGANVADPDVLNAVIDRVMTRVYRNFVNTFNVRRDSDRFPHLRGKEAPDLLTPPQQREIGPPPGTPIFSDSKGNRIWYDDRIGQWRKIQ